MDDLDWAELQALLAVARAGSLSAAARAGGLSQPTLSRRLAALEGRLGERLMERGAGGVRLTDAGREALARAEEMEAAAHRLSRAAAGRARGVSGVVRVTASRVVATYLLPGPLAELLEAEPALEIELVASDASANLLRREADIAVRMYRPAQADLVTRKVSEMALGLFASPAYLARHGAPRTVADLAAHRVVGFDRSDLIVEGFAKAGFPLPRRFFRLRTDDQVAYWEAVAAGAGIGAGQKPVAARDPRVTPVLPEAELGALPVWLTAHADLRGSARVRRVFDHLAESLPRLARGGAAEPSPGPLARSVAVAGAPDRR
ncbi:LysR family transcriptional regulator [Albimonas pacifica]|uniref:ModE molybdate transport repressor domain-containing protein n=1 Tax=Albimonas pacifica TaxID=1114924 RepID=A0A1I3MGZ4_9RHOB|nr:LysR family transcriptional regulator [Albimonas pacifica]SFI96015.1 ModE molybdate transport repressor domain-containing protein [Albimonas pacifica]